MSKCHKCKNKFDSIIESNLDTKLSRPRKLENGCYENPFPTWNAPNLIQLFKFLLCSKNESNLPNSRSELNKELPMFGTAFQMVEPEPNQFRAHWIGHATILIQAEGLNILTDPIFSQRASPSQLFGPKRYREPACDVGNLPEQLDYVLISHNHYDHLDTCSVNELNNRYGSKCRWLVPLGLGAYLKSMNIENYAELDWWQKDCYHDEDDIRKLSIYLTPSQHWSRRGLFDTNRTLWGSFTIVNNYDRAFFFAGDTGYCEAFKEIGDIFGPFLGAAIPIGAYKPRWFMKASHVDPAEAIKIHQDLRSFKSIAIHHATFPLSNEFYKEPSMLLEELMKNGDKEMKPFRALYHGERIVFQDE